MKNMNKLIASAIVLLGFATNSNAQATATATATATIISRISLVKNTDMNFGNIAASAFGGTVELPPAPPTPVRIASGGVSLPATIGTVTAANFTVTGNDTYTYAITLPFFLVLTHTGLVATMNADAFTSTPSGSGLLTGGTEELYVGATLNIGANQLAGVYTSGNFDVTVNYN